MTTKNNYSSTSLPDNFICPLSHLGIIRVAGEEQIKYLQGQLTNDMQLLHLNQGLQACHCDFKGKMWSNPQVISTLEATLLISHRDTIESSLAELNKFGVFSKVELSDVSTEYQLFGASGEKIETTIEKLFTDIPFEHLQSFTNELGSVICINGPITRYLLLLNAESAEQILALSDITHLDNQVWKMLDIQGGVPLIESSSIGEFVPQMLNMHSLKGISFNKGCYTGQETVARTKFLGKNKRAGFILSGDIAEHLVPGDILEIQMGENWRRAGSIINIAHYDQQTWLFAVMPNDTEESAELRAKSSPENRFSIHPLPYQIEE